MAKKIMIQGTASSAGKSIMCAALCRIFLQDGHAPVPFKSQNMALNSFVTPEGGEMGRAQVVQAQACKVTPSVLMNPILLKPTTDRKAQVIVNGKVLKNMDAMDYFTYKTMLKNDILTAFNQLDARYDMIVIEGAGSPAEINLKENDIVNMGMAELVDSPVLLVADIDRGGVFASIAGTIMLLDEHEKNRVKGIIINKFRGDVEILKPGIKQIEDIVNIPVIGVIPYMDLNIDDEDSVTDKFTKSTHTGRVSIEIVYLPHISNFTDFDILHHYPDAHVRYVMKNDDIGDPDILIIPGTKNTIEDLIYLKNRGFDKKIVRLAKKGTLIVGICGGFQMLGNSISDKLGVETDITTISGLALLNIDTHIEPEKVTEQITTTITHTDGLFASLTDKAVTGYEIHCGKTTYHDGVTPFLTNNSGVINGYGNVVGTYLHGFFDNSSITQCLLNAVLAAKGIDKAAGEIDIEALREQEFEKLAKTVREHLDMDMVYRIMDN